MTPTDPDTLRLAKAAGILIEWQDYRGQMRKVSVGTLRALLDVIGASVEGVRDLSPTLVTATAGEAFHMPADAHASDAWVTLESNRRTVRLETTARARGLAARAPQEPGYHRISTGKLEFTLAVAPGRAREEEAGDPGMRSWGLTAQLYSLYRPGDGGVADYTALRDLVKSSAAVGASALAVSPLHAQFSADLSRYSPYAPSSRLWLNVLHIDVDAAAAVFGLTESNPQVKPTSLVDWPDASRRRLDALRLLYRRIRQNGALQGSGDPAREFRAFRRAGGDRLTAHAVFETLHAQFYARDSKFWHWRTWPAECRSLDNAAIQRLARKQDEDVTFHLLLQWLAARQFREAAKATNDGGMRIGIIKDIAVGADGGGSETWSNPGQMLAGASIGAPPDEFNTLGQAWGVTTFGPRGLKVHGFQAFIELLRHSLSDAGGIRIDHVLGLQRLWIVPDGADPRDGAYIRYPLTDLLRLATLEAHRGGAIILGEDLGTVPAGFRDSLSEAGIKGMQVLWFERDGKQFRPPKQWRKSAAGMTTTHDLPTVAGWWAGKDVAWRRRLNLFPNEKTAARADADRKRDRPLLWRAFLREGVAVGSIPPLDRPGKVITAAIAYLGKTNCDLALLPLEDALGRSEQPNLPGTIDQHPNWRRRILIPAGDICGQKQVAQRLRLLAQNRGGR